MSYLSLKDINLYYQTRGQGPPLLMIMGMSANVDWWPETLLSMLEKKNTLILFDNRGAGRTSGSTWLYSINEFADDALALLDALEIKQTAVFGVSMGGMIAQTLTLRYPERVSHLILGCTACSLNGLNQLSLESLFYAWLYGLGSLTQPEKWLLRLTLAQYNLNTPENSDFMHRINIAPTNYLDQWKHFFAVMLFNSYPHLNQISCPVLIMTGKRDFMIPHRNSDILAEQIPHAKLIKFPNASHAFIRDETEGVTLAIHDFAQL